MAVPRRRQTRVSVQIAGSGRTLLTTNAGKGAEADDAVVRAWSHLHFSTFTCLPGCKKQEAPLPSFRFCTL